MRRTYVAAGLLMGLGMGLMSVDADARTEDAVARFGLGAGETFLNQGGLADRAAWAKRLGSYADPKAVSQAVAALDVSGARDIPTWTGTPSAPRVARIASGEWLVSYDAERRYRAGNAVGSDRLAVAVRVLRTDHGLRMRNVIAQ